MSKATDLFKRFDLIRDIMQYTSKEDFEDYVTNVVHVDDFEPILDELENAVLHNKQEKE